MSSVDVAAWLASTGTAHPALDRSSVPERIATLLREMIMDGAVRPGDRLSDDVLSQQLSTSRNTVREAFRLLGHERLLVHELNRGVFVRRLTPDDVVDIYQFRRLIECAAVRHADSAAPALLEAMDGHLRAGRQAAAARQWRDVGTRNVRFHRDLARLLDNRRVDQTMQRLLAELRLAFHVMDDDPEALHAPYLPRNQQLLDLMRAGNLVTAERALDAYLGDAEQQLIRAYERAASARRGG